MRKFTLFCAIFFAAAGLSFADNGKTKVVLLISEQNIDGPQKAWWASEIDLSVTESQVAQKLLDHGAYEIVQPQDVSKVISQDKAFRMVDLSESKSVHLGNVSRADYVLLGKAIASAGGNVPQSNMRSCFANITAKLIRVKDSKVVAYFDAAGSSIHTDLVTGGKEALSNAAGELAAKLIDRVGKDLEGSVK